MTVRGSARAGATPVPAGSEGVSDRDSADAWRLAVLIALAVLPYANTLLNDFLVYDDRVQILTNPYVHSFRHWREIFTTTVWSYLGVHHVTNYYRPLMVFGFLICYRIFGPLPYGFHLASVLLHAATVCVIHLVSLRVFRDRLLAFAAAALFAVHPIHTESVAWISAVTDVEVTFFYLLTFWFFLQVAASSGRRRAWAQGAMAVSFLLTFLSKEQAATLPLLATIYEHCYRDDRANTTWAQKASRYGLLWLMTVGYLFARVRLLGSFAVPSAWVQLSWLDAFLTAPVLAGQYLWKLLWPVRLVAFYPYQRGITLLDPRVLAGLAAVALCALVFLALWRRARQASFGLVWFAITLAPVLNARWLGANVFCERYLYLPSVGFCWVVAWAWTALWRKAAIQKAMARNALAGLTGVIVVLCAVRTYTRNQDWHDDLTLLTRTLAIEPGEYRLHEALGLAYWLRGEPEAAEPEWREAHRLNPSDAIAVNFLGMVYAKQGRFAEAAKLFRAAIVLDPKFASPHLNLGAAEAQMGRLEDAEPHLRAAALMSPLDITPHNVLGKLYFDSGRLGEAEGQFRQSVNAEPNLAAYDYLGYIYQRWRDWDRAERAFKAALALNDSDSHAHFNLGLVYASTGRTTEARKEYQRALASDPGNQDALAALRKLQP